MKYSDEIEKNTASVDDDRECLSLEKVDEYIKVVLKSLPLITDLRLVLNMDECGFGRRPDYKKR